MQLEELEAAEVTARGAVDAARRDTQTLRESIENLQVDNQRCAEAVEEVAERRKVTLQLRVTR